LFDHLANAIVVPEHVDMSREVIVFSVVTEPVPPVFALVRHLAVRTDRDELLGADGGESDDLHAALVSSAEFLAATKRVPFDGWLHRLVRGCGWLTNPSTPSIAGLRGRPTRITTVLRHLAKNMNASRVVDKLHLGPNDLYCALNYAADVLQHLPRDLAREAEREARRAHLVDVGRRLAKLRAPPINVGTGGIA